MAGHFQVRGVNFVARFVLRALNKVEKRVADTRNNTLVLSVAHYAEGFAAARLAVRKQARVVALPRFRENIQLSGFKQSPC
jgi:hypothetical protein